jgi:hypothetical protein
LINHLSRRIHDHDVVGSGVHELLELFDRHVLRRENVTFDAFAVYPFALFFGFLCDRAASQS